jgi:Abnormal spindle-like microcephaly-assoc'd, ASPM-SPD-2-Hydin
LSPTPALARIISLDGDMAFGTIGVGSSWEATLRISNSGTEPLTVTGVSVTPSNGVYSSSWTSGTIAAGSSQTATIRFTPLGAVSYNGTLIVSGNYTSGTNRMPISGTGQRDIPFRRSGSGNAEFFMPTDVERVRIVATYTGNSSSFMVDNGYFLLVEERLGTAWNQTRYDGTHPTPGGGYIGITNSSGVAWAFEEIR